MDKLGQEWVSAAVDGEVDNNTLAELANDIDSHEKWRDYQIIGDAMRNELPSVLNIDLSMSIAEAIAQEPCHHMADVKTEQIDRNVSAANQSSKQQSKVVPLFKQFGQYAIAASVALVVVVSVDNYNQSNTVDTSPLSVLNTRPLVGSVSPVSLQTGSMQQSSASASKNDQVADQRLRINAYIQDHQLQQRLNSDMNIDDNSQTEAIQSQ
ncbi:sigma-E factor negative regulatory protein [Shewanella surugensis]|uniref:Anti-sigma-E factor RseA n=1 Tax=Shewanella surugensis TaxID=212020 RepID=A0ABT0L5Z6_9GAMM|nr:RseA family anti-sigma factor [Shewanella surugensis]MCL1123107.1 anti-sigma factor [Shewanella surugensis]